MMIVGKVASQRRKNSLAAFEYVAPCRFKVVGVPRVGDVGRPVREVHQLVHFSVGVAAADASHVADVPVVHADEQVVAVIVGSCELSGRLAGA